ncbi:hypothetical protein ACFC96_44185 [Streptomyces sp. NPDC055955]|uniref:hypothetical protein n=1 Tax=Streptomyces sp. NPDC055955 TaxID=3345665 RepID=UPI0035E1832C
MNAIIERWVHLPPRTPGPRLDLGRAPAAPLRVVPELITDPGQISRLGIRRRHRLGAE